MVDELTAAVAELQRWARTHPEVKLALRGAQEEQGVADIGKLAEAAPRTVLALHEAFTDMFTQVDNMHAHDAVHEYGTGHIEPTVFL